MKKILALIAIATFLVGCTPADVNLGDEEDTMTPTGIIDNQPEPNTTLVLPTEPETLITTDTLELLEEIDAKNKANEEATAQKDEDLATLDEIATEREITAQDCELLQNETAKADCLLSLSV